MVINHLLTGMILQVVRFPTTKTGLQHPRDRNAHCVESFSRGFSIPGKKRHPWVRRGNRVLWTRAAPCLETNAR